MLMLNALGAFALLGLGLYCLVKRKDIFRMMIGISLMQYAAQLLLVTVGVRASGAPGFSLTAPFRSGWTMEPLPQSLAVLSILTGLAVTALGLALCVRVYLDRGTLDPEALGGWKQ